jgi:hypothetical protein
MSVTLPNMGLVKWDGLNDKFSHEQLAANFQALDDHDHSDGKGVRIPAGGLAPLSVSAANIQDGAFTPEKLVDGAVTTPKIQNGAVTGGKIADDAVTTSRILDNAVTTPKINNGAVTDAKLQNPNNAVYHTLHHGVVVIPAASTVGHYYGTVGQQFAVASGNSAASAANLFPWDANAAFNAGTGQVHKWRIVVGWASNNVSLGTSVFTGNLYRLTSVAGTGGNTTYTLNTTPVATKSLNGGATPGTSATNSGEASADITAPSSGLFVPGVQITTATTPANSEFTLFISLQHHYVP